MTTIDAAAARYVHKSIAYSAFAAILALGVSGCSTGGGVLSSLNPQQNPAAPATAATTATVSSSKVTIAPLIGPPNNISSQLTAQLTGALQKSGVQVVTASPGQKAAADYTLRGYIVAARETAGTKVSYIWDVANPAGQRVNRITGEEVVTGAATTDPWTVVSPTVLQTIAGKTATTLSAWLPKKTPAAAPRPAASAGTPVAANRTTQPARTAQALKPAAATTGSIQRPGALAVVVPRVAGAPGDGANALALALQNELRRKNIPLATGAGVSTAHRIEGKVAMTAGGAGKQKISIDWVVKDPRGNKLGTVSQKNEIPAGSLNGKWGGTAGAAAAAAAQGIIRLLPQKTASR